MSYYNQDLVLELENKRLLLLEALEDLLSVTFEENSNGFVVLTVPKSAIDQALTAINKQKD